MSRYEPICENLEMAKKSNKKIGKSCLLRGRGGISKEKKGYFKMTFPFLVSHGAAF
jgi:hypothetical protein